MGYLQSSTRPGRRSESGYGDPAGRCQQPETKSSFLFPDHRSENSGGGRADDDGPGREKGHRNRCIRSGAGTGRSDRARESPQEQGHDPVEKNAGPACTTFTQAPVRDFIPNEALAADAVTELRQIIPDISDYTAIHYLINHETFQFQPGRPKPD